MRQLVVAVLAYIVLQLFLPSIWSRVMSEAPPWVTTWITFVIALICIAFVGFSDPIYSRLSNPSTYPWSSTVLVAALVAGIGATAWWQFAVSHESSSDVVTLKNVNTHVRKWVFAFPDYFEGGRTEEVPPRPELYFGYHVIFADNLGIGVSQTKDQWSRFITPAARFEPIGGVIEEWNRLSPTQRQKIITNLDIEASKANIRRDTSDPSKSIKLMKDISINGLTETVFYDAVRELHSNIRFVNGMVVKQVNELSKEEVPTPPSPTPDTGTSPN